MRAVRHLRALPYVRGRHHQQDVYKRQTLDWALSGQNGLRFDRDDAFRRIKMCIRDREMHETHKGKVGIVSKVEVATRDDLSTACLLYTSCPDWSGTQRS